jgi:hypothetical protein
MIVSQSLATVLAIEVWIFSGAWNLYAALRLAIF